MMISLSMLVLLVSLAIWLVFTKWQKVADPWVAELGRITYFAAALAVLIAIGSKAAF